MEKSRTMKFVRWVCALFLLAAAGTTHGDVKLLDSFPKSGAELSETVTDVRLWFDEEADPAHSTIQLMNGDARIPVVAVHTMGENDLMGMVRGSTPPGSYRLLWRATALNSDQISSGEIYFTIVESESESESESEQ